MEAEEDREEAMELFKNPAGDKQVAKAMVAAYSEVMARRQAQQRPILRQPAGPSPAAGIAALQKDRNKAAQLARQPQSAAQKAKLWALDLREKLAQAEKDRMEAEDKAEEHCKGLALAEQKLQAAMASKEKQLQEDTGGNAEGGGRQAAGTLQAPFSLEGLGAGLLQDQSQLNQFAQPMAQTLGAFGKSKGYSFQQAMEAMQNLPAHIEATVEPKNAQPAPDGVAAGDQANAYPSGEPGSAPLPGEVGGQPQEQLNEDTMQGGKRKIEEDQEFMDGEAESPAVVDLVVGEEAKQEGKKVKIAVENIDKKLCPSIAQTIKDTEAIDNIIKKRRPAASGSAPSGQPRG
jgi:hypothetical protein